LEFEILNLFGIWNFEFGISAGLPAVVICLLSSAKVILPGVCRRDWSEF